MAIMMNEPIMHTSHGIPSQDPAEILAGILIDHTLQVLEFYREKLSEVPKK